MKNQFENNKGITLVVLVITIVVMLILAGVSLSAINPEQTSRGDLDNQGNIFNEFYNTSNEVQASIKNELSDDYNKLVQNTVVEEDIVSGNDTNSWNGSINHPNLREGMTAIYFENGTEKELTESSLKVEWEKWYDYSNKKWANARSEDGSYWVWIPRFAYRITESTNSNATGMISIIFVDNNNNNNGTTSFSTDYPTIVNHKMTDYVVHPVFTTDVNNGGTDNNISGFWISKYEISMERSLNGGTTWQYADGVDALTKNAGNENSIRAVSKPNVSSWRNISIGNAYSNSYNYNRAVDSHLMKNSEWGAVAYLAHSAYGIDGAEIAKNNSDTYITGTGGNLASTTGNETGIFDLNGGAFEFVSAYILNTAGQLNRETYGSSFSSATQSNSYVTIYPHDETLDTGSDNWNKYNNYNMKHFGDAVLETSTSGAGNNAWNNDVSIYPYANLSFFVRGGINSYSDESSGIFMLGRAVGSPADYTYRIVLF